MTEINEKIKELLQKIRDGPPFHYQTQKTDWYLNQFNQLREILEGLQPGSEISFSLAYRKKRNGGIIGTLIRETRIRKIKILKNGWIEFLSSNGPQSPPLHGWITDLYQLEVRNSAGVKNVEN